MQRRILRNAGRGSSRVFITALVGHSSSLPPSYTRHRLFFFLSTLASFIHESSLVVLSFNNYRRRDGMYPAQNLSQLALINCCTAALSRIPTSFSSVTSCGFFGVIQHEVVAVYRSSDSHHNSCLFYAYSPNGSTEERIIPADSGSNWIYCQRTRSQSHECSH